MTTTPERLADDTAIYMAGLRAAAQLPPASPQAAQRVAQILSAALMKDNGGEEKVPAA